LQFNPAQRFGLYVRSGARAEAKGKVSPIDFLEKLANEGAPAEILRCQFDFAKQQYALLESKVAELTREISRLEGQIHKETLKREKAQKDLLRVRRECEE